MSTKRLLAGVSLAALGAAGLTMLSAPAFATPSANWYVVPAGTGTGNGPTYKCEGNQCPVLPTGVTLSTPPEYAEQAIDGAGTGATLTIPGYGSGSPYGGFSFVDLGFSNPTTSSGGVALISFTMPVGETIASFGAGTPCPGTITANPPSGAVGGTDGQFYTGVQALSCTNASGTGVLTATVTVSTSAGTGTAWYQLPAFKLAVNAALIANLGTPTANGGSAVTLGGNCETLTGNNFTACEITTSATQALTGSPSGVLATSQNVLSLRTFNNSQLICIDVLEDQQPGTRFQQPCGGISVGSSGTSLYASGDSNGQQSSFLTTSGNNIVSAGLISPTKVDGTTNGAPEAGTLNDPACKTTDINVAYSGDGAAECGNGSVTGAITSEQDVLVADKGTIEIDVTELLALDGIHIYQWVGGSVPAVSLTIVGICAGLEGPIENIGSTACVGGIKPFTGETTDASNNIGYVGLTPLSFVTIGSTNVLSGLGGFNSQTLNDGQNLTGTTQFCPKEDDLQGSINFTTPANGSTASFTGLTVHDIPNSTILSSTGFIDFPTYYEFCDYANGTSVLGPVAQWFVTVTVDAGKADVTVLTDNPKGMSSIGTQSAIIANPSQPADALLVFEYNGIGQLFQFTNGGTNYSAYLRIVNLMEDYVSCPAGNGGAPNTGAGTCGNNTPGSSPATSAAGSTPGCVTVDPNGTCEPAGAVVCKVWGDDGQNAFVTLWNSQGTVDGQLSGTNFMFPVASLFTQAGIVSSNANPFDLGSLLCFHNERIHLTQFWIEPNGSIVNIQ
jgi:hypothetical protein